jgi:hypothetical protein
MTHCGVPLYCYGQCKVNGASEANLCKGEQEGHKVKVDRVQANTESRMKYSQVTLYYFHKSYTLVL